MFYRLRKGRLNFKVWLFSLKQKIGSAAIVKAARFMLDEIGSCELSEIFRKQHKAGSYL